MITNYDQDVVQNDPQDLNIPEPCTSPHLFCGVPFRRYPDARPMGYPFDRLPFKKPVQCNAATGYPDVVCKMLQPQWFKTVDTLEEYVHSIPNTATKVVRIYNFDLVFFQAELFNELLFCFGTVGGSAFGYSHQLKGALYLSVFSFTKTSDKVIASFYLFTIVLGLT